MAVSSVGRLRPRPRPCSALSAPTVSSEVLNGTALMLTRDRAIEPNRTAFIEVRRISVAALSEPTDMAPLMQANSSPMVAGEKPAAARCTG